MGRPPWIENGNGPVSLSTLSGEHYMPEGAGKHHFHFNGRHGETGQDAGYGSPRAHVPGDQCAEWSIGLRST